MRPDITVSLFAYFHDRDNTEYWKDFLPDHEPPRIHESWEVCHCNAAEIIRKDMEERLMDEDSPNNMLTTEEHIALFNKFKKKDENTPVEELIATRNLMKRGIAVLRTKVQAKTVILNEKRANASRKEKEAIIAADKLYSPKLRPAEKASEDEIKLMEEINNNPRIKALLKALPTQQYNATFSLIKQLGLAEVKKMLGWDKE